MVWGQGDTVKIISSLPATGGAAGGGAAVAGAAAAAGVKNVQLATTTAATQATARPASAKPAPAAPAPSAAPSIPPRQRKEGEPPRRVLVVDSGGIISGGQGLLQYKATEYFTTEAVINEIRDSQSRHLLESFPFPIETRSVDPAAVQEVARFASKTGDLRSLSATDVGILALTLQFHKEVLGDGGIRKEPPTLAAVGSASAGKKKKKNKKNKNKNGEEGEGEGEEEEEEEVHSEHEEEGEEEEEEDDDEGEFEVVGRKQHSHPKVAAHFLHKKQQQQQQQGLQHRAPFDPTAPVTADDLPTADDDDEEEEETTATTTAPIAAAPEEKKDEESTPVAATGEGEQAKKKKKKKNKKKKNGANLAGWFDGPEESTDGWVTFENMPLSSGSIVWKPLTDVDSVAIVTTDFAMQNVIKQIGLELVSIDGLEITTIKQFVLKCHACLRIVDDESVKGDKSNINAINDKMFCPFCGSFALMKVSKNIGADGVVRYSKGVKNFNLKGTQYSIPKPVGGRNAQELLLREDQKQPRQKKNKDEDIYENAAVFALNGGRATGPKLVFGHGRKNPNEARRH